MCRQIKAEGYTLTYFSEGEARDAVYCPLSPEEGEAVWELLLSPRPVLGAVGGLDWNRDLSPWPAPGAFGKGTDFAGKGGAFLTLLTEVLIPQGEKMMDFHPRRRALAGYSLAGLFALWSLTQTNCFQLAASMSGSLWYDGFLQLLEREPLVCPPQKVYLSLGEKEKRTRNLRLAQVENATRSAAELLSRQGIAVELEFWPGGHFQDVHQRIARGIQRIVEEAPACDGPV